MLERRFGGDRQAQEEDGGHEENEDDGGGGAPDGAGLQAIRRSTGMLRRLSRLALLAVAAGAVSDAAVAEVRNPNGVAVIIGNKEYRNRDVPPVAYAHRDAEAFKRYVVEVLGFDPANVFELRDADREEMFDAFGRREGTMSHLRAGLARLPEGGDVVVYYSGHGVPGREGGKGYLLPVDVPPRAAREGYPLDLLIEKLGALDKARSVQVFLDACFSGGSHAGFLVQGASPVAMSAAMPTEAAGKVTVLTAAEGSQLASWDDEAGHGLFTHHLLDALYGKGDRDRDGRVTASEAGAYLDAHMSSAAWFSHRREQKAVLVKAAGAEVVLASAEGGTFPARPALAADTDAGTRTRTSANETVETATVETATDEAAGGFEVEELDEVRWALKRSNVRSGPGTSYGKVGGLDVGAEVTVTGQVAGRPWLRIEMEGGGSAWVYAKLLGEEAPVVREGGNVSAERLAADREFWASVKSSREASDFDAYLGQFPEGTHAQLARKRRDELAAKADDDAFARAKAAGTSADYAAYLSSHPGGRHEGEARRLLEEAEESERLAGEVGKVFRDCPECPEMVVVPSGSFMMGSPSGEKGRDSDEGPVHRVTFERPFAVGVYEVTFGEWDACVSGGGCGGHRPSDRGWGRGRRPVINVNWKDAQAYVRWLSRKTGEEYRLLSESEWEYVARAGTRAAYWWGDGVGRNRANCSDCGDSYRYTAPVGSFSANPFGLHDVHGNVWEWGGLLERELPGSAVGRECVEVGGL